MIHVTEFVPPVGTPPDDWPSFSWLAVWDRPVTPPCGLDVGTEVILVRQNGEATWRTDVSELIAVPFEHVAAALDEVQRRWHVDVAYNGSEVAPGVMVAWRARPTAYLGTDLPHDGPIPPFACVACAKGSLHRWMSELDGNAAEVGP